MPRLAALLALTSPLVALGGDGWTIDPTPRTFGNTVAAAGALVLDPAGPRLTQAVHFVK